MKAKLGFLASFLLLSGLFSCNDVIQSGGNEILENASQKKKCPSNDDITILWTPPPDSVKYTEVGTVSSSKNDMHELMQELQYQAHEKCADAIIIRVNDKRKVESIWTGFSNAETRDMAGTAIKYSPSQK
jgi:hypothetical protein